MLEAMPERAALVTLGYQGEQHLRLLCTLRQVAQVVYDQQVVVVQLPEHPRQIEVSLGREHILPSLYAGMNSTERPDCTSLCPMAHMACVLPVPGASTFTSRSRSLQGRAACLSLTGARVVLEGVPRLAGGQLGCPPQPDPPVLWSEPTQCRKGVSMSRIAEAIHGLSRQSRQPELPAQIPDRSPTRSMHASRTSRQPVVLPTAQVPDLRRQRPAASPPGSRTCKLSALSTSHSIVVAARCRIRTFHVRTLSLPAAQSAGRCAWDLLPVARERSGLAHKRSYDVTVVYARLALTASAPCSQTRCPL